MTAISKVKLYHYPATRSARVKWILNETIGETYEVERIDLYAGAQYAPGYVAKNPNHNVPLLEIEFDDGRAMQMRESAAMIAFFADAFPEKRLAPVPGLSFERADYLQMLHFGASPMDMMLWQIRIHEHVLQKEDRDPRIPERYRGKFRAEVEPQLIERLSGTPFICGDDFSAADCLVAYNVGWANAYGLCTDKIFRKYLTQMARRPAYQAAFADVGEFTPEPPPLPAGVKSPFNG